MSSHSFRLVNDDVLAMYKKKVDVKNPCFLKACHFWMSKSSFFRQWVCMRLFNLLFFLQDI